MFHYDEHEVHPNVETFSDIIIGPRNIAANLTLTLTLTLNAQL